MSNLRHELDLLGEAVMFLTRLPARAGDVPPADQLARAAKYFPVVGLIVGLIAGAVWLISLQFTSAGVAAGLALGAGILVTGALHEDGWADCCDGLGGGASRERALEIMRDSRIGVFGAIGLTMSIGLRWAGLASLDTAAGFAALVVAFVIGRAMIVLAVSVAAYAREEGVAGSVAGGVQGRELAIAMGLALVIAFAFAGWSGFWAFCLGGAAGGVVIALLVRRLGGYTGDGLGAVEQVSTIAVFVALASS